jgi:1-acyl-sn-glycerol-3-phosphate acyltransferase
MDLSKITYSFAGSYERLKENANMVMRKPDIASVQFRLEFPIAIGLSIPIAYTYSNNTEMMMKKENKFNVGLHLDIDKLYEIARGAK